VATVEVAAVVVKIVIKVSIILVALKVVTKGWLGYC